MRSHVFCSMFLLVLLSCRAAVLVQAAGIALSCGYDVNCQAIAQLIATVDKVNDKLEESASRPTDVNEKLDKQAVDLRSLTVNMNRSLASTATVSTQLERHSADLLNHDKRFKEHELLLTNMYQLMQNIFLTELGPQDCKDIRTLGFSVSGVYRVYTRRIATDVYCDFKSATESWLVFQRRKDGSVSFERLWKDYANGFGDLSGEFWLGNDKLSLLTMNRRYKLRVELEDFVGEKRYAEYTIFSVKSATDKYRLTVGGYSGNAGDSMAVHNSMMFTTKDVDNDAWSGNCAVTYRGAWWYGACHRSNLNALYLGGSHTSFADGIEWFAWRNSYYYSYKTTEMKITAI